MVTGVPAGPDVGEILTTLVSTTKYVRASVLSPDRIESVWRPPRSSGTVTDASTRPPAPTVSFDNSVSLGAKPLPETRLPWCVPQTSDTGVLAGRPLAFSDARVNTGPCVGVTLRLACLVAPSDAGTGCFG